MSIVENISALPELERAGYIFEFAAEGEVKGACPFHKSDSAEGTKTCFINTTKNVFYCQSCAAKGDLISFLSGFLKVDRATISVDLATRYHLEDVKVIEPKVIETDHQAIWNASPLLEQLYARGVTDDDIRKHRLGESRGRITIPIKNGAGSYVNIRRYMPGAPGRDKMRNTQHRGKSPRPFPIDQLELNTVVVCGGEIKAIVAARILNPYKIGAITCTGGESNWPHEFITQLKGKKVYVCLDIDEAGVNNAREVAIRASVVAEWVGISLLPLDIDKFPGGDINDFCGPKIQGDLYQVIIETPEWTPEFVKPVWDVDNEEPKLVQLSQTLDPKLTHQRVQFAATITAEERSPYVVPKDVTIVCDRSQVCCGLCPVFGAGSGSDEGLEVSVPCESSAILEVIKSTKQATAEALKSAFLIPAPCKVVTFDVTSYYDVHSIRISPSLQLTNRDTDRSMIPAVCVGCTAELNAEYVFTGRMHPHPMNQEMTLVLGDSVPATDSLSSYQPTGDELSRLTLFQAEGDSQAELDAKLTDIYTDFEANVTKIYQRKPMHLMVDLTYHSVLIINFDDTLSNGWVQSLIIGDSSQGKSELLLRLMEHYQLGEKVECKNATVAGLLGGLAKFGESWMVAWGVIPAADKRFLHLEELKGASTETLSRLTDMRSSGVAEIPKIEKRRTHARARLVATSNPRSDVPVSSYSFGIQTFLELIGAPEDVRRFDCGMVVASGDVDTEVINSRIKLNRTAEPKYTSELCRELVLWAWTRTPEQVIFDEGVRDFVIDHAIKMSKMYTETIPLVDRGSIRFKLAKLAVALAARLFSCSEDRQSVIVKQCHVEYIVNFLNGLYQDDTHGYERLSEALKRKQTLADPDKIKDEIFKSPNPEEFVDSMLYSTEVTRWDIGDWAGIDHGEAQGVLSLLVRKRALTKIDGPTYRKTPEFVVLLRNLLENGELKAAAKLRTKLNSNGDSF